ncbi:MAG: DUF2267 domain-containing protein [Methyloligellaceae bacterium]
MTQPQDVVHASKLYQGWLSQLKDEAMLATHNQSQAIMRAVMHELRRYLTIDQVLAFVDALPPLPRGIFIENWRPSDPPPELDKAEDLTQAVVSSLSPHVIPPQTIVADVFKVWSERSEPWNAKTMRSVLPDALKPLWPEETSGSSATR